ncbi:MAG: DUF4428 domain-containing protein [Coriobacteriia bacterium]|nr:DUF4428 domain-containing protein [Coriobacteriia bacterium]
MGLFDKKYCDICGEKIGVLGNRKLEDGNLCKDCAKGLSPFFTERRRSTVADIKQHLAYREDNRAAVTAFNTTRALGQGTRVLIDEHAGKFMIAGARKSEDENPDVVDCSLITNCSLDIDENKTEIMNKGKDGKSVSYVPPRYSYSYDFNFIIYVNHPWFDEMRFKLNSQPIKGEISSSRLTFTGYENTVTRSAGYKECEALAEEIKAALNQVRQEASGQEASGQEAPGAAVAFGAPNQVVTCPLCGATTTPGTSGRCEFCRGVITS